METNATILLNGQQIATVDNSWLRYVLPVRGLLRAGSNTLAVVFVSVYDACRFTDPGTFSSQYKERRAERECVRASVRERE